MKNLRHLARIIIIMVCGLASTAFASDPTAPQLRGRFEASSDGSSRKFVLEWDAVSNATYQVQAAADLNPGTLWKTIDVIAPIGRIGSCSIMPEKSEASSESLRFFRLGLPQPVIFAVEPALLTAGIETMVHVVGQCFSENMELRVGPRALTNREIINPNLMRAPFTPATPGTYVFELVVGGHVLHTFTVFAVDTVGNRDLLSQEVPDFPPASPGKYAMYSVQKGLRRGRPEAYGAYHFDVSVPGGLHPPGGGNARSKTTEAKVLLRGIKTSEGSLHGYVDDDDGGSAAVAIPAFMKNARKAKTSEATVNVRRMNNWPGTFDVQPFSGELQHQVVDMIVPGLGIDLVWGRCYRSQTGPNTPMGNGWTHFYDIRIEQSGADLVLNDGTGRRDLFIRQADGTYRRDGFFYEITLDSMNRVKVKFPWLGEWEFHPFDGSLTAGRISSSRDANGNTMTFSYDTGGMLSEIIDTLGRTCHIGYTSDSTGQPVVSSFTDSQGRVIRYTLSDSTRDLVSVRTPPVTGTPNGNDFPDGKTNSYTYSSGFTDDRLNHNLLQAIDSRGAWLRVTYRPVLDPAAGNFDAVAFVQQGQYSFFLHRAPVPPAPSNAFAVVKAVINDAGNVRELFYDARHRCVRQLELTGRANPSLPTTDTENRPTGKLRPCDSTGNPCDPDYFETRASYNRDNLCTSVTFPRGNSVHYRYGRDFDKNSNPRKTGDLLVVRELPVINPLDPDSDDDGVLDSTERVWRFETDPRFGSPAMGRFANGPRQSTSRHYWTEEEVNAKHDESMSQGIIDNENGLPLSFSTRATDPLGNVTVFDYDPAGNCITVQYNPKEISVDKQVAWNSRGQLVAVTNAPDANGRRRVDTATYYDSGPQAGYLRTATVDARGPIPIVTTYEYDARGNVTRVTDPRGFMTDMVYNQLDQLLEVRVDSTALAPRLKISSTLRYDANDNVVQVDHENRDENGVLDSTNPQWTTQCRYDALNRMTDCWVDKDGSLVLICDQVPYDAFDNVVLYRSPEAVNGHDPNAIVRFEYDERNLLLRRIRAPGTPDQSVEQIDYTPNGRKSTQWEPHKSPGVDLPESGRTTYAYDGFDRLISVFDPMGHEAEFAYDDNDNFVMHKWFGKTEEGPIGVANLRYHEWRWRYNSRDLPVSSHRLHFDPATQKPIGDGESTHTYTYAPNGQLLSETDDNGHTTRYTYDTVLRLSSVIDPKTNTVMYAYDPSGNVVSVTEIDRSDLPGPEQRFVQTYDYDPLGRLTRRTDNLGNNENWFFDSRGNCVRAVDAAGNPTLYTYDGLNRVTLVTVDLDRGGTVNIADISRVYVWDDNSRLSSEMDENSNTTTYNYDSLNRKTLATSPDGTLHRFVWDSRSELVSHTDPNGTVFSNRYDLLSRLVRTDITPGPGVAPDTTFEEFHYNSRSELVSASNDVSWTTFTYDSHGNRDRTITTDGYQMLRSFDAEGNQTSLTYPSGLLLQYTYDAANRLRDLQCTGCIGTDPLGLASYAYDGDRLSRVARANGVGTRVVWNGMANSSGQPGDFGWKQVANIRHARVGTTTSMYVSSNRWDHAQNSLARDNHLQGAVDVIQALRFAYDGANRLVQSQRETGTTRSETIYNLDGNGNRVVVTTDGSAMPYFMDHDTPEPADFQMDQYTFTPFGHQQYDNNGNLLSRDTAAGSTTFSYDARNRLVLVSGSHGPASLPIVSYAYDALGQRISKTTYTDPPPAMPVTTRYIHDNGFPGWFIDDLPVVIEARTGPSWEAYVWGSRLRDVEGNGRPDLLEVTFSEPIASRFYHHDDLGNVVALTDAAGNPIEKYLYDDYGRVTFLSADGTPLVGSDGLPVRESPVGNRFLFQGMELDSETGLYTDTRWDSDPYAEDCVRTYDPNTGRYTSRARGIIRSNNGNSTRRGVIRTNNGNSTRRGIIRSNNGSTSRKADPNVGDALGALRSVGHNPSSFANDNPWTSSRLTGRPVGQPNAAGLGAHVQRFGNLGGTVNGLDGKLGGLECNFGAFRGERTFAYWPHMHQYGTHKPATLQTTRGFLTRGVSFPH